MQISVAGCSWGVCFAAIAFSIVSAFCANGIQPLLSATSKVTLHWSGMIVEFRIFAPLTNEKVRLLPFCDAWKHLPSLKRRKWDIRPYICIGHKKVCSWDLGSFAAIGAKYTVQTKFVLKENYSRYFCDDKLLWFLRVLDFAIKHWCTFKFFVVLFTLTDHLCFESENAFLISPPNHSGFGQNVW